MEGVVIVGYRRDWMDFAVRLKSLCRLVCHELFNNR